MLKKTTQGSGLKNIKERIAVFNGYLHIASSNDGTEVEIEIAGLMNKIRIAVVDDHQLFREGVHSLLLPLMTATIRW